MAGISTLEIYINQDLHTLTFIPLIRWKGQCYGYTSLSRQTHSHAKSVLVLDQWRRIRANGHVNEWLVDQASQFSFHPWPMGIHCSLEDMIASTAWRPTVHLIAERELLHNKNQKHYSKKNVNDISCQAKHPRQAFHSIFSPYQWVVVFVCDVTQPSQTRAATDPSG